MLLCFLQRGVAVVDNGGLTLTDLRALQDLEYFQSLSIDKEKVINHFTFNS